MCGRYALFGPSSRLREQFGVETEFVWPDAYNVAPSQDAPVIRASGRGGREIVMAQWGLQPPRVPVGGKAPRPLRRSRSRQDPARRPATASRARAARSGLW